MNLNLAGAVLVSLWAAGWTLAAVRAALTVRAVELAGPGRRRHSVASEATAAKTVQKIQRRTSYMIMIRSIVRPERVDAVLAALMDAGFPAVTKMSVVGRGKQRGIKIGEITYDEIPKELLLTVVKDADKDFVIKTVLKAARTGDKGAFGDGKIFVSPVEEVYTISSGHQGDRRRGAGRGEAMKEVMAIVRMNMMNKTKKALAEAGISSMHRPGRPGAGQGPGGHELLEGAEKGYEEAIAQLGQSQRLIPKRIFSVVVPDKPGSQGGRDHHHGQPDRQVRRRQDLRHARPGFRPGPDRRVRRHRPGRSLSAGLPVT